MSSKYDDPGPDRARPYRDQLEIAFHELEQVQDDAEAERVRRGTVSNSTTEALERAVLAFRRRLRPFAPKNDAVADIWERINLDAVPDETATVVGYTEPKDTKFGKKIGGGEPIVERADPNRLMIWADALITCYTELGFGPEMAESDVETVGGDSL